MRHRRIIERAPGEEWRDSFSVAAQDWLTIYSWAVAWGTGEDQTVVMKRLIMACFRRAARSRCNTINLRTAEAIVAEADAEAKAKAKTE